MKKFYIEDPLKSIFFMLLSKLNAKIFFKFMTNFLTKIHRIVYQVYLLIIFPKRDQSYIKEYMLILRFSSYFMNKNTMTFLFRLCMPIQYLK
jgi:hypothetical protein